MSEVRFYHLTTQNLEQALPAILLKALSTDRRAVVRFGDKMDVEHFNDYLWTYNPNNFIPHGTAKDGHEQMQPIYLTDKAENPNKADMLVVCNAQTVPENTADFSLCCDFLNGNDEAAVSDGRARWKAYQEAGHNITYWQQTPTGSWEQKT